MAEETSFEEVGGVQRGLSGSQLMLAAQGGDAAAFREMVGSYDAMVMRVVLTLTGSEASAQAIYCEVFCDAFASMNKLDSHSSVFVWLYRILVKHCIEYCRRNQRPASEHLEAEASPSFAEVLSVLPPKERVVFLLKHFQGLKIRTLAEIFACPPEFIIEKLTKSTNLLRTQLRPHRRQTSPP